MAKRERYEQETIITFNEAEGTAEIYTSSEQVASKLKNAGLEPVGQDSSAWWFEIPKQAIRVKVGRRAILISRGRLKIDSGGQKLHKTCNFRRLKSKANI